MAGCQAPQTWDSITRCSYSRDNDVITQFHTCVTTKPLHALGGGTLQDPSPLRRHRRPSRLQADRVRHAVAPRDGDCSVLTTVTADKATYDTRHACGPCAETPTVEGGTSTPRVSTRVAPAHRTPRVPVASSAAYGSSVGSRLPVAAASKPMCQRWKTRREGLQQRGGARWLADYCVAAAL